MGIPVVRGLTVCGALALLGVVEISSSITAALLFLPSIAAAGPQSGSIQWVGRSDSNPNVCNNICADGLVAVGAGRMPSASYQPFIWRVATGVQNVDLPATYTGISEGSQGGFLGPAISGDGATFCGTAFRTGDDALRGFAWRQSTGVYDLGMPVGVVNGVTVLYSMSTASAISNDGLHIGGTANNAVNDGVAAIWSATSAQNPTVGSWNVIGNSFGGVRSDLWGMSADGTRVAGTVHLPKVHAYRWSAAGGLELIPSPPESPDFNLAFGFAISADGSTVVGISDGDSSPPISGRTAGFRWTATTGLEFLVPLNGFVTQAYAVSANGSVVGGTYGSVPVRAMIWNNALGSCDPEEVLAASGVDVHNLTLVSVLGVSADGSVITGYGTDSSGKISGFVATLPQAWVDGKPLIRLSQNSGGNSLSFTVNFVGVLQKSSDLVHWDDLSPQPTSPFTFSPTDFGPNTEKLFFRARLPDGGGLVNAPLIANQRTKRRN